MLLLKIVHAHQSCPTPPELEQLWGSSIPLYSGTAHAQYTNIQLFKFELL